MIPFRSTTPEIAQTTPPTAPLGPWYVCFTKPRQEQYAASKLSEQGYEVYLPILVSWARQGGEWRKKRTVMFPRYAFVRPTRASQAIGPVRSTPGVTSLVSFGHILALLSGERLEAVRTVVNARAVSLSAQPFEPGDQVVFCSGPLKGARGIVSSVAAQRVRVMMSLLGQDQKVGVGARDLALA